MIRPTTKEAYQLLHDGLLALSEIEQTGINIDVDYVARKIRGLTRQIRAEENALENYPEIKEWKTKYGYEFNIESNDQLADILFNVMGYTAEVFTKGGKPSTSQTSLEVLDLPFVKDYVHVGQLRKAKNTYLENILSETVKGAELNLLHPFFNLHTVVTYRSSSSMPNFQNIPVRVDEIKKLIRTAFIPRPGNRFGGLDFGGIEVCISACYHKDPQMIKYIIDPTTDMHRDAATDAYLLPSNIENSWFKKGIGKKVRYCGKNCFVFPEFYGDYYASCATSLWKAITLYGLTLPDGTPMKEHLAKHRIKNYEQFEKHIQAVEDNFWNSRFKVYTQWKKDWMEAYEKNGYFDLCTGFRCSGPMDRNDVLNYPIQGSAFHCLLWSLIRLHKFMKEEMENSWIIGQIHDEIVLDAHPKELPIVLMNAEDIMTKQLPKFWDWIIVPMTVEAEFGEVNESWFDKKTIEIPKLIETEAF
jgi:DNA polymerase-1